MTRLSSLADVTEDLLETTGEMVALAVSKPLNEWDRIPDEQIPIPHGLIAIRAFYKFLDRGGRHGHDVEDWLDTEKAERAAFRRLVSSLRSQPESDYDDPYDGVDFEKGREPSISTEYEQTSGSSELEKVMVSRARKNHPPNDEFGNYWPTDPPLRCRLSAEEFADQFRGYELVVVESETDQVIVAGASEECLERGLRAKSLSLSACQIEPGPSVAPCDSIS